MTAAAVSPRAGIERSVRRALGLGGGLLVLGLAAVGVGKPAEGGPIALAGLLATIYGIHRFGRLGPVTMGGDPYQPDDEAAAEMSADRTKAIDAMWVGGLALLAGVAFVIGGGGGSGAYAVMIGGGLAFAWGSRNNRNAPDPAPHTGAESKEDDGERPRPRKKRPRRKHAAS